MKLRALFIILIILFFIGCDKRVSQESEKYKFYLADNDKLITILDESKEEVLVLSFDEEGSISEVYVNNYKGLWLSITRHEGTLIGFGINDDNIDFYHMTLINPTDGLLIQRDEGFHDYIKTYRLLEDGQTEIEEGE